MQQVGVNYDGTNIIIIYMYIIIIYMYIISRSTILYMYIITHVH